MQQVKINHSQLCSLCLLKELQKKERKEFKQIIGFKLSHKNKLSYQIDISITNLVS